MKITKELCTATLQILNKEGKRHKDGWIGVLNQITNEQPHRESVANLVHMVLSNFPTFAVIARKSLPKYLADHPEIKQPESALESLIIQLAVRLIVYTFKHAEESAELQTLFDLTEEGG